MKENREAICILIMGTIVIFPVTLFSNIFAGGL